MSNFASVLQEQLKAQTLPLRKRQAKKVQKILDMPESDRKTRLLKRIEDHVQLELTHSDYEIPAEAMTTQADGTTGIDWSKIDWSKVFDIVLKIILAIIPLFTL